MEGSVRRTIVVSGVNLNKGGTLTILRECLSFLSEHYADRFRIVALVMDRKYADFPGIEYIELSWPKKSWLLRLWCEYVTMHRISKQIAAEDGAPVHLWFSMHDTSPRVIAERQAVYCHTSFPFLKWSLRDFRMDFKIPLFAIFTRFAYRINCHSNDYLIVQQNWFREALSAMTGVSKDKFIVAPPATSKVSVSEVETEKETMFFYASTADCHKNFETLCEASRMLQLEEGEGKFRTVLTIKGDENKYAQWLRKKWGKVSSIDFHGFLSRDDLYKTYASADCLVFPSRVETWGLPISEYMQSNPGGALILADLPYAHETASGAASAAFFDATDPYELKTRMKELLTGQTGSFSKIEKNNCAEPVAEDWGELFDKLINQEEK